MDVKGITAFLVEHEREHPVSFHMPGHKGAGIYRRFGYEQFLDKFIDLDITEIPGADNLFKSESIIRQTQQRYANIYGVKSSYLLVNGTSGGLIAAILATVPRGSGIIMARNCHKSVFNAVKLGNITPAYVYPDIIDEYGITGAVSVAEIGRAIAANPECKAIVLPSPNYYGICSDIREISRLAHEAGMVLIVDQAHGAHLKLFEGSDAKSELRALPESAETAGVMLEGSLPESAETAGADIVVCSTHKTLASLTQSAVMNINSDRVSFIAIEDMLQTIESSSPSYILMASLDINASIIAEHGEQLIKEWRDNLNYFYMRAKEIPGLNVIDRHDLDRTKLNLDMSRLGIDGHQLEQLLMEHGIYTELNTGNILMAMTGIGNCKGDYECLLVALEEIAREHGSMGAEHGNIATEHTSKSIWSKARPTIKTTGDKKMLPLNKCSGKVCGSAIIPYPPGIPLICEGELIDQSDVDYISRLVANNEKVIGVNERLEIVVYEPRVYRV